jgi:hypothetical protein
MIDIDELERLHAGLPVLRAATWNHEDGEGYAAIIAVIESDCDDDEHPGAYDAAVAGVRILNALPGLLAELRALRSLRDEFAKHCGHAPACRFRPVDVTVDGKTITVMNSADSHRLGAIAEERAALREVAEAARRFVPTAEESAVFALDARTRHLIAALAKLE